MKKAAGFTLIELVIVIVILGILGAVAAPKFLNLQGDAYGANLQAVKSSLESASTLVNAKAILAGKDKTGEELAEGESGVNKVVKITHGYPAADVESIKNILDIKADAGQDYVVENNTDNSAVYIYPSARAAADDAEENVIENCSVKYEAPENFGDRPTITINKTGC
ncbi:type II secretion system protein [Oceanisphaera avium]|uniref:MSHA biogenesis protein MshA n=1 Tax=Oceanisphaera avium TaxID=1903694 RepID=A0A1Y0CWL0_9GAMM|nr:type II secretion system protein [Oceanisphaera avium]ART79245.1 hypothetical protein CBP12_03030 [Oceanisphaera avium]